MNRLIFFVAFLFGTVTGAYSIDYQSTGDGSWSSVDIWSSTSPGTVPGVGDDVIINNIVTIQAGTSAEISSLHIAAGKLIVDGTLIINGNLTMANTFPELVTSSSASVIIYGSAVLKNKVDLNLSSFFIVFGDFNKAGDKGSLTTDNAQIYVMGSVTTPWTDFTACEGEYDGITTAADAADPAVCDVGNLQDLIEFVDPAALPPGVYDDLVSNTTSPATSLSPVSSELCSGSTVDLTISDVAPSNFTWYKDDVVVDDSGTTNPYSASAAGTYYAIYKSENNWYLSNSVIVTEDVTLPIAQCQDVTVVLDGAGQATISPSDIDNGSTDNCGIASMTLSHDSFRSTINSTKSIVSSDGYTVNVTISILSVIPSTTTNCASGYNYNVELYYNITFTGDNIPTSLNNLQGNIGCDDDIFYFDLPRTAGSGTRTTTSNPYTFNTDCATVTPESLNCQVVDLTIGGPGISNQTIAMDTPAMTTLTVTDEAGNISTCTANVTVTAPVVEPLFANITSTAPSCGVADGSITIAGATGGGGTYEYSITGGTAWFPTGVFINLTEGSYNILIRDAANTSNVEVLDAAYTLVPVIDGDPSIFGDDEWIVYAYAGNNLDLTGINYQGYYIEPNLTFNTTDRWGQNDSPSYASGYSGCAVGVDNHTFVHKRTNFPCGTYQIDVTAHDDGARLYIDGVNVWEQATWYNNVEHPNVWTGLLTSTSEVEFRVAEQGGGSLGALTFILLAAPPTVDNPGNITVNNGNPVSVTYTGTATEYLWSNDNTSIGLAASGTGDITSFNAVNNGATPVVANITVTPSDGICGGTPETFTITVNPALCDDPDVPTVSVSPDQLCPAGDDVTLSITGNLNDASQWVIYTGSCGGNQIGTTTSSTFVVNNVTSTTAFFVRGEGGCVTPGACGSALVTVEDNVAPVINNCPSDISVLSDDGNPVSVSWTAPTASDNCSVSLTSTHNPGDFFSVDSPTTVTYTATDGAGNTTPCSFTITVTQPAVVPTPSYLSGYCTYKPIRIISSEDLVDYQIELNIPFDSQMETDFSDIRFSLENGTELKYWIEDYTASSAATVWVKVSMPAGENFIFMFYGNGSSVSQSDIDATMDQGLQVEYFTYPGGGNPDVEAATLQVVCSEAANPISYLNLWSPNISLCGRNDADHVVLRFTGWLKKDSPGTGYDFQAGSDDGVRVYLDGSYTFGQWVLRGYNTDEFEGYNFNKEIIPFRLDYFENSGGAQLTMGWKHSGETDYSIIPVSNYYHAAYTEVPPTIVWESEVTDNTIPTISCPATINIQCDSDIPAVYTSADAFTSAGGTLSDDCLINEASFTLQSQTSDNQSNTETITRTYYVEDITGNSATCTQLIIINDNTPPEITCLTDIAVNVDAGICGAVVTYTAPIGTDNCSGATTVQIAGLGSGATFPVGETTETYEVTDASGNKVSCSFKVIVTGNEAPRLDCPTGTISLTADLNLCTTTYDWQAPLNIEDCNGYTVSWTRDDGVVADAEKFNFAVGTTVINVTVTDDINSLQTTCMITVFVDENPDSPPTITAPDDVAVACSDAVPVQLALSYFETNSLVVDNCGYSNSSFSVNDVTVDNPDGSQTITRRYSISDYAGNTDIADQIITVTNDLAVNASITITPGCSPELLQITATSSGFGTPAYQWKKYVVDTWTDFNGDNTGDPLVFETSTASEGDQFRLAVSEGGCVAYSPTLTVAYDDQEVPVFDAALDLNKTLCIANGETTTTVFGIGLTDGTMVSDNCTAFSSLKITYVISGDTEVTSPATGQNNASDVTFNVGTSTVLYTVTDDSGNFDTYSFNVVVNNEPILGSITTDGDAATDGSGYLPNQGSSHNYSVTSEAGYSYTWRIENSSNTDITASLSTSGQGIASYTVTWGANSMPGNYRVYVIKKSLTTACESEAYLNVTVLNSFDPKVKDFGDACHEVTGTTTMDFEVYLETGSRVAPEWFFNYDLYLDGGGTPLQTGSITVTSQDSYTVSVAVDVGDGSEKNYRFAISGGSDSLGNTDINSTNNEDLVKIFTKPSIQF